MKFQDLKESNDPQPKQDIVDKFADTDAKTRTWYISQWADKKGIKSDDAMHMAGYIRDGYIGAGAWNWRYVGMGESVQEVAGAKDCWDGYKKDGTQAGTGKNKGKRVNKCVKEDEKYYANDPTFVDPDGPQDEMIGEPDSYYDAEDRQEAYNDLQDALAQSNSTEAEYVKDGSCPECPNVEDDEDCNGFGNYGCDDGILTYNGDDVSWKEIQDHDERQAQRQSAEATYPGDESVIQQAARMMPNMDDPRMIVQQIRTDYPQLGRAKASDLAGKAKQIAFPESIENESMGGKDGKAPAVPYSKSTEKDLADKIAAADEKRKRLAKDEKNRVKESDSEDAPISKMLAKALGDENRWTDMSPQELFAELESKDSETADMIALLAKSLYDVRLKERVYKDVGVADTVKDQRGKEFQFDKNTKKFKSQDGEEADINTKLGKDLMRLRKNHMKRTTPSYPKNKIMASAEFSHLQQAYDKVYQLTDKMGDEALEQMNRYAPKFSDALEKHDDIESIEQNDSANVSDYIKELDYVLFQLGESINEAEYQGKKVELNKPKRGGSKKYYVYVKSKKGNVKKISFGDPGLKTKSGNKARAKSFAARHNCEKKNDKTKAGYWACRLPRYGLVKGGKWW